MVISETIKGKHSSIPLIELEQFEAEYRKRLYYSIESKKNKMDFARNSVMFLACTLERSYGLYKGCINSLNALDIIVCYLAVRAHMESTGSLAYFLYSLMKYYDKQLSFDQMDDSLKKLYLGRKYYSKDWDYPERIQPISVMTLIDSIDKMFFAHAEDEDQKKMFRDMYDWLSEFCHPNHFGQIIGVHLQGRKAILRGDYFPNKEEIYYYYVSLLSSCRLLFHMFDNCTSLLQTHEDMPMIRLLHSEEE